ncbi:TIM-barrel domain-containing protein, partial [Streptomyces sp. PU-14G]|uniref:TIM-barrel domain-containing protein n=1 Tax=Streptomyces sp. PU-14G TaxID=2800808 RepID=UPI0034DEAE6E
TGDRGAAAAAGPRWLQRCELPSDARFFGLGGRADGPRLHSRSYRLWNTAPGPSGTEAGPPGLAPGARSVTMPLLVSVADAGTLLVFHDNSWDGRVDLREGAEGLGSGHDRPGRCEVRMTGGPLRYWAVAGAPSRVLHGWAALTGAPAVPPGWALGYQHALGAAVDERRLRRAAEGRSALGLPLRALHLDEAPPGSHGSPAAEARKAGAGPAAGLRPGGVRPGGLRPGGVRLVSSVGPAVRARAGDPVFDSGRAADVFVREAGGRVVLGGAPAGEAVFPDFTDRRVRKWWGALYAERLEQGFAGVWHTADEPVSLCAFGDRTLPRSARHALEGRGGDHREAHNVYALTMAKAACAELRELCPEQRPFPPPPPPPPPRCTRSDWSRGSPGCGT